MDDIQNRLRNAHNSNQGNFKRVLCVCSAGLLRSPTIAWVLSNRPYNCNTRACGSEPSYALIVLDPVLVEWAEEIVIANSEQFGPVSQLVDAIEGPQRKIINLDLPDMYKTRSPELIRIIRQKLHLLAYVGTPPS